MVATTDFEAAHSRALGIWLLVCAASVYLMIVVGGITRLTQSGLSMVEWSPLMGILPPMNAEEWMRVFAKYQASPEYQKINFGMTLDEFKGIFWWEYGHRVLGRLIGLIYLLPLLYFLIQGWVPKAWRARLFGLFLLGGLQGLMGWYMVKSGLVDVPQVSQYRLTAHLGVAILIFACMWWFALHFLRGRQPNRHAEKGYQRTTFWAVIVVVLMMLSGGFVAGTKAGYLFNTFPTMNGEWLPAGLFALEPLWRNWFENPVTIQFSHRLLAMIVVLVLSLMVVSAQKQEFETAAFWPLALLVIQTGLGISALLYRVPVALGAAHQAGAVALLAACLYVAHRARFSPPLRS